MYLNNYVIMKKKYDIEKLRLINELDRKQKLKSVYKEQIKVVEEIYIDLTPYAMFDSINDETEYKNKGANWSVKSIVSILKNIFNFRKKTSSEVSCNSNQITSEFLEASQYVYLGESPRAKTVKEFLEEIKRFCANDDDGICYDIYSEIASYREDLRRDIKFVRKEIRKYRKQLGFSKNKLGSIHRSIIKRVINFVFQRISGSTGKEETDLNDIVETTLSNKFNQLLNHIYNEKRIKRAFSRYFNKYFIYKYQAYFETRYYSNYPIN